MLAVGASCGRSSPKRRIENGLGVGELLSDLRKGAKVIESKAPADMMDYETQTIPTVAALLKKSTDRLDDFTRECFAYLGPFARNPRLLI